MVKEGAAGAVAGNVAGAAGVAGAGAAEAHRVMQQAATQQRVGMRVQGARVALRVDHVATGGAADVARVEPWRMQVHLLQQSNCRQRAAAVEGWGPVRLCCVSTGCSGSQLHCGVWGMAAG